VALNADHHAPDQVRLDTFEEVAFRYEKIEWTWTDGDVSATDDWLSGIA
jgi:type VI secretion system secreted protein Hcp